MNAVDILMPAICLFAFIGYVTCLSKQFWVTNALTVGLGYLVSLEMPIVMENLIYWGSALGLWLAALLVLRLLPRPATAPASIATDTPDADVVVDGTNVMYWGGDADLDTLRRVVDHLRDKRMKPFVFLDASSRHHLNMKFLDEKGFAKALGLPRHHVMVCPARTEADAFILKFARENNLPVVSNDRFGDRAQQAKGLKLIKGGIAGSKPMLHGI